ncbi:tellurium resistance protein TerY [Campylobacterota bacterium]|nr:tellurium resistance protein TerY [Campylobacterota bacterium]
MSLLDKVEIPRRAMTLFFLIDSSGSMDGSKIGAVNAAIEEVIPMLRELSEENADAQVKIAVLEFSDGVRWLTPSGALEPAQFHWTHIYANGLTDFGAACRELNAKLSTKAFMKEATGSYAPAIFLLSDGAPTDDWERELGILKQNNWFKAGIKVACAIGEDADFDVLTEFTGSAQAVLMTHNAAALKKTIKFVSVRASQVASKSSNAGSQGGDEQKQIDLNEAIQEFSVEIAQENTQDEW